MSPSGSYQPKFEILLVEDNEDDVLLTEYALREAPASVQLHSVKDGMEALAFLRREAAFPDAPRPDVILLDLNMPRMDGRELLRELKRDDDLKTIPAIVLTTSSAEPDVLHAYRSYAAAYMTKPMGLDMFTEKIQLFVKYWLGGSVVLPSADMIGIESRLLS